MLPLAFLEECLDCALAAGAWVPIGRDRNVRSVIVTMPIPAEIRSVDSQRDHLALRANERLLFVLWPTGTRTAAEADSRYKEEEHADGVEPTRRLQPLKRRDA